jgi:hypothetical protein
MKRRRKKERMPLKGRDVVGLVLCKKGKNSHRLTLWTKAIAGHPSRCV